MSTRINSYPCTKVCNKNFLARLFAQACVNCHLCDKHLPIKDDINLTELAGVDFAMVGTVRQSSHEYRIAPAGGECWCQKEVCGFFDYRSKHFHLPDMP